jgi:antitoxin VapB
MSISSAATRGTTKTFNRSLRSCTGALCDVAERGYDIYLDTYPPMSAAKLCGFPMEFRFEGSRVFIRRDPKTGDVILSHEPESWDGLFELYGKGDVPEDFMGPGRSQAAAPGPQSFQGNAFKVLRSRRSTI